MSVRQKSGFEPVVTLGERLLSERNSNSDQIKPLLAGLGESWKMLKAAVSQREAALERSALVQQYTVDANEADSWLQMREAQAVSDDLGKDEHGAQQLCKKTEAVQSELEAYAPVLAGLKAQCDDAAAFSIVTLGSRPGSRRTSLSGDEAEAMVKAKYDYEARRPKELSIKKGDILKLLSQKDANWWKVATVTGDGASGYVPAKYVKIQKPREAGTKREVANDDTTARLRERQAAIERRYESLKDVAAQRVARLTEAVAYHQFTREAEEVERWMGEKEGVVQSAEVGSGVKEVEAVKAKFDNFRAELEGSQQLVDSINTLADALIAEEHSDAPQVQQRRDGINTRWEELRRLANGRAETLDKAFAVESSRHDLDKAAAWINEKSAAMSDDVGKDVSSVQALQRQHDQLLRDLKALEGSLQANLAQSQELEAKFPDQAAELQAQRSAAQAAWDELNRHAGERTATLARALQMQEFLRDFRAETSWIDQCSAEIQAMPLADDINKADLTMQRHKDIRSEIDARKDGFAAVGAQGARMVADGHSEATEVQATCSDLTKRVGDLEQLWGDRLLELSECYDFCRFQGDVANTNAWLDTQEAFLASDDLGNSTGDVASLLRNFHAFQQRVEARRQEIDATVGTGRELVAGGHYAAGDITAAVDALLARTTDLYQRVEARELALANSEELHQFLRDADDLRAFIGEKRQTATDKCYIDSERRPGRSPRFLAKLPPWLLCGSVPGGLAQDLPVN